MIHTSSWYAYTVDRYRYRLCRACGRIQPQLLGDSLLGECVCPECIQWYWREKRQVPISVPPQRPRSLFEAFSGPPGSDALFWIKDGK